MPAIDAIYRRVDLLHKQLRDILDELDNIRSLAQQAQFEERWSEARDLLMWRTSEFEKACLDSYQKYRADYPQLVCDHHYTSIGIGPGWMRLLRRASDQIIQQAEKEEVEPPRLLRAKEKWGRLHIVLTHYPSEEYYRIVEEAETESQGVCERCGAPGSTVDTGNWLKTLCGRCYAEVAGKASKARRQRDPDPEGGQQVP